MRRTVAVSLLVALALTGLVACGQDPEESEATGSGSVEVEGKPGKAPEVTWDGQLSVDEVETRVLVEGDGEPVEEGDRVLTHLWIGNGFTNETALDTYASAQAQLLTVGDQLIPGIRDAIEGQRIGSRVLVTAPAEDAFGADGNPSLGIANKDSVVLVVDLASGVLDAPKGKKVPLPDWMPTLVEKDGVITGWDFSDAAKPDGELHVLPMVEGTGEPVRSGSTIAARYLGQVYEGKKPFDENYSAPDPTTFQVGAGSLIKAWDEGLVGIATGSRVAIVVPPRLGYGKKGNEQAGIKGTDTLYFVLDVLGTA